MRKYVNHTEKNGRLMRCRDGVRHDIRSYNHLDAAAPDIIMSASSDSGGLYDTWNWAKDSHDYVRFFLCGLHTFS